MSNESNTGADVDFIKALAEVLRENDLSELEVKRQYGDDDGLNVRISRIVAAPPAPQPYYQPPIQELAPAQEIAAPAQPTSDDPADLPGAITSPMVGTVYLKPEPSAGPFVGVGDKVNEGDTLLIIEAMKTMNHIPAPRSGTVKRIVVEDGSAVEFGAPLMIVE